MNAGDPQQSGAEDLALIAARLAAIVESSEDAIVGKDLRGIVTSWNTGAERIFGYTAAEMIGQPFARVIRAEREDEETEILAKIARGERVGHFEKIRIGKDGRKIDVSVTVSPIRDATGVNAYVVKPVKFQEFVNAVRQLSVFWVLLNEPDPACRPRGGIACT